MNCESKKYRRIVIKIGSNVLTREDGRPDTTRISALVDQIAGLYRAGVEVILVSWGPWPRAAASSNPGSDASTPFRRASSSQPSDR